MTKREAVVAGLNRLNKTGLPFSVLASTEPEIKDVVMASHICSDCGTHFSVEAGLQPFCVTCGSDEVEIEEEELNGEELNEEETSAVICHECDTHNIISDVVAKTLDGTLHCVTCGTKVSYSTQQLSSDNEDDDYEEEELTEEEAKKELSAENPEYSEDFIADDEDEDEAAAILATKELDDHECDLEDEEKEYTEKASKEKKDSKESKKEKEEEMEMEYDEDGEKATIKLINTVEGDLSLDTVGNRIIAFVKDTPVAVLSKEKAGEYASVFHSTTFSDAIQHTAKMSNLETALSNYNFDFITASISIPETVSAKVAEAATVKDKEVKAELSKLKEGYKHCLQIASAGINKSFFRDEEDATLENPLKASLYNELSALNIKNPEKLIDKVFATHSDKYHSKLLAVAEDLLAKSEDVRNELAKAVKNSKYQIAESDEEESSDMEDTIEARLEYSGLRKTQKEKEKETAKVVTPVTATIQEIRKVSGGRLFNNH